jgi:cellulose biosynthesis protein BcsQ
VRYDYDGNNATYRKGVKSMKYIEVISNKGGVGTTTISCAIGVGLAERGKQVLIVDNSAYADVFAVLGMELTTSATNGEIAESSVSALSVVLTSQHNLMSMSVYEGYDFVIIDAGATRVTTKTNTRGKDVYRLAVVNNEYISIRNFHSPLAKNLTSSLSGLVVVNREGNALTVKDTEQVMNKKAIAVVPHEAKLSRAVDSGLFTTRIKDETAFPWVTPLLEEVGR